MSEKVEKLKPCAHCGGVNIRIRGERMCYAVCSDCGASTGNKEGHSVVVAAWNRRTPA